MVTAREWKVTAMANGQYRVENGERVLIADAVRDGATSWIWIDGHLFEIGPVATARARAAHGDEALMPQMSAKVIRVLATAGQSVELGDTLVVLEAMKMELPIRAPRSGVVTAVRCAEGDLVQPGVPLVEMSKP